MLHKLVISHGGLADELVATTRQIGRQAENFHALSLDWGVGSAEAEQSIRSAIAALELRPEDTLLILSPLFGDTPFRAACPLVEDGRIALIGGINLALLLKLACSELPDVTVDELAVRLRDRARGALEVRSAAPSSRAESVVDSCSSVEA